MKVLDAYVDGRGITKFLTTADTGPRVDQGAFHAAFCEALMFPSSWSRLPTMEWEPVDEHTARVAVSRSGETESATVGFDGAGYPATYEAMRFKGKDGPKVSWRISMVDWRRFGHVAVPSSIEVLWTDEPGPWLRVRFERVEVGPDLAEPLARARAAIAAADRHTT